MSAKTHFLLFGYMNEQKVRYCCQENSSEMNERAVHSAKETEWCGVKSSAIIKPYIFEEEQLETATVNVEIYRDTLEKFLAAERRCQCMRNLWFKQEGCQIPYI
jgi:hypothetical protein